MATSITAALAAAIDSAATNAATDAFATDDAGPGAGSVLEIRTGSKPATPEATATGTLLATVTVGAWTGTTDGSGHITAGDPAAVTVAASGVAGYFRLKTSGGTAVLDGTVGLSSADLILDDIVLVAGGSLDLGVPTLTVPVTVATS